MRHRARVMGGSSGLAIGVIVALALAGCTVSSGGSVTDGTITVQMNGSQCVLSQDSVPEPGPGSDIGTLFTVTNNGDEVAAFSLIEADSGDVVGELRDLAPGLSRDLVVHAAAGHYVAECSPGPGQDGIRTAFAVTGGAGTGNDSLSAADTAALTDAAGTSYRAFVREQAEALAPATEEFAAAYAAGEDDTARALYPTARAHWESFAPVASPFQDLLPALDARQADLVEGEQWTGWHRIEKDLWSPDGAPLDPAQRAALSTRLVADTAELVRRIDADTVVIDAPLAGDCARQLLDAASRAIADETERWSHSELSDIRANVDGARAAFESLRPLVENADASLARQLDRRFDDLDAVLVSYGSATDRVASSTTLDEGELRDLAIALDALAVPVSALENIASAGPARIVQ
jgi:iron uptake system component EfeO